MKLSDDDRALICRSIETRMVRLAWMAGRNKSEQPPSYLAEETDSGEIKRLNDLKFRLRKARG